MNLDTTSSCLLPYVFGHVSRSTRENFFRWFDIYCQAPGLSGTQPDPVQTLWGHELKVGTGFLAMRHPDMGKVAGFL